MSDILQEPHERRVMIVPVGLEKDRIVNGCTAYAINIVYLLNNDFDKYEKKKPPIILQYTLNYSKAVSEIFKNTQRIMKTKKTRLNSFIDCITVLNEIYTEENKSNKLKEIFINISTATKAFSLAAYIFALFHPRLVTVFYMKTTNYILLEYLEDESLDINDLREEFRKTGLTKGPYDIDEIPLLPIINFTETEKIFIQILSKKSVFKSIDEFMSLLPEEYKNINRVQIRRILGLLEEKELIYFKKKGRYQQINVDEKVKKLSKIIS